MNKQLILKEWKEKLWIPIFALAFFVLFAVVALVFADRKDFLDYVTGAIQVFFLPLTGILLGASAFGSEFKDGSWAYLFSRPLKKSTIWLSKFTALAGLLVAIFVVYYLFLPLIPGFRERLIEMPLWGFSAGLSLGLFLFSFSISYLTEKQFLIVFFSLFIPAIFGMLFSTLINVASMIDRNPAALMTIVGVLGCLAFGGASLFAFCRSDFSQPRAKISRFLKALAMFLVLAVGLSAAALGIGKVYSGPTYLRLEKFGQNMFLLQSNRGIFSYGSERDDLIKLTGRSFIQTFHGVEPSAGGGKIAWVKEFVTHTKWTGRRTASWAQEVWIMDADGRNKHAILKISDKPESSLFDNALFNISMSPDGRKLVLISRPETSPRQEIIWSMNSDGTDLKSHSLNFPNIEWIYCSGWSSDSRRVVILVTAKEEDERLSNKTILRLFTLSLDSGEWQLLPEDISGINGFGLSPEGNRLGYFGSDASRPGAPRDILRFIDIETLVVTDIISVPGIGQACWNPQGNKIAFLADRGRRLGIISVPEKKILAERTLEGSKNERIPWTLAWTDNGQKIAMSDFEDTGYALRIFDQALRTEKAFPLPPTKKALVNLPHIYGIGAKVLVFDSPSSQIWSFDSAAEKWKKLY